jgi:hypothetical protein
MGENSTLGQLKAYDPFNFSYGDEPEPKSTNPKLTTIRAHYPIASEPGLQFLTLGMFVPAGLQYFSLKTAGPTLVKRLVTEMLIELYNSHKEDMPDDVVAEIKEYEFILNWRYPALGKSDKGKGGKSGKGGKGKGRGPGEQGNIAGGSSSWLQNTCFSTPLDCY